MKGYIYLIENKINGKKYIGKTYNSITNRWKEHQREMKRFSDRPLYRAMNKYGVENFEIKEIEYVENCEEREVYWIDFYKTFTNGYNATKGGDGTVYFSYSDEEVIKIYEQNKSVKETAKYFNCDDKTISIRIKRNGIDIPIGGNIHSEKKGDWKAEKILQFSLQNEYIQSFESYSAGARWIKENDFSQGQLKHISCNIAKNCKNQENRKQAYGFIWKHENKLHTGHLE